MKNKKLLSLVAILALSLTMLAESVSATGPSGSPPGGGLPDSKFNSVTTGDWTSGSSSFLGDLTKTLLKTIGTLTGASDALMLVVNKGGTGAALEGLAENAAGNAQGVKGQANSSGATGVYGVGMAGFGVRGVTGDGTGVVGEVLAGGTASGLAGDFKNNVVGSTNEVVLSSGTVGVKSNVSGSQKGVWGVAVNGNGVVGNSTNGVGVEGTVTNPASPNAGVHGSSAGGTGVLGDASLNGVQGQSSLPLGRGVWGTAGDSTGQAGYYENTSSTNSVILGDNNTAVTATAPAGVGLYSVAPNALFTVGLSSFNGNNRTDILNTFCTTLSALAGSTYSMVATGNPCTIHFTPPNGSSSGNCSALGGSYNGGAGNCTWADPGYTEVANLCLLAGSPSPFVSGGHCIWTSHVANINGGVTIDGPIDNQQLNAPVLIQDPDGLSVGKIVSPNGLTFNPFSTSYPNMYLSLYSDILKVTPSVVNTLLFHNRASDGSTAPLLFNAIESDAVYNDLTGATNGTLNGNGQSVGITANGDRAGIIATSWHGGLPPQASTYSNGGGVPFRSLGIYALGNTTARSSGAGLFEVLGGSTNAELAWVDAAGASWAISANGNTQLNGNLITNNSSCGAGCQIAKFAGTQPTTIYGDGWMGVGQNNPAYNLDVTGTGRFTGNLRANAFITTSDIRLKNVLGDFNKGLAEVLKLNTITYKYKEGNAEKLDAKDTHYGFSAQEVQKVIPEAVKKDNEGYWSIDTMPLITTLVNAVKDLNKIVENWDHKMEELNAKVDNLQKENSELKIRLDKLENLVGKK